MRSKLSQPPSLEGKASGTSSAFAFAAQRPWIAILLLFVTSGCPFPKQTSDAGSATPSPISAIATSADGTPDEFLWPSAPDHSVLRLEVATPDSKGTIEIELMPELAPKSVDQLIALVRNGYYDGTTFHRVIRNFMIQGGDPKSRDRDPTNDGTGGVEHALPDERSAAPFVRGVVALANRGRADSNSSQFFILQSDQRSLDGQYTVIGRVVHGIEFVDHVANTSTDKVGRWGPKDRPMENVVIRRADLSGPLTATPSAAPRITTSSPEVNLSRRETGAGAAKRAFEPSRPRPAVDPSPTGGPEFRRAYSPGPKAETDPKPHADPPRFPPPPPRRGAHVG